MKFEPMKPAPPVTSIFFNLRIFDVIPLTSYREIIEILDALYNKTPLTRKQAKAGNNAANGHVFAF